jgi:hypothetical protein
MNTESQLQHGIDNVNEFMTDAWNCQNLCHCWSINRQRKQSHCRPWNCQRILGDSQRLASTVSMNWRPTHQIDCKNRVMADSCNCQKRYVTADPKIGNENRDTVYLEIFNEWRVTADVCNRQRQWIHDRRIKSIAKIESWPTHGIVKNAMSLLIQKLAAKTESLYTWKSSMNIEWQPKYVIDIVTEFTTDASNRLQKIESWLTHGIVKNALSLLIHKSSAKT